VSTLIEPNPTKTTEFIGTSPLAGSSRAAETFFAIAVGAAISLCVYGYQFGQSNHTVYLLDALHRADPSVLASDWFTTQTFQYHAVFGWLTLGLMRIGLLEPGFLIGYLALVILLHMAWLGIVRTLGASTGAYLVSVVLYHVSAGGTGLGMYQFLQDSSFLPSNVANVAMLWGIYLWLARRPIGSGAALGIAGIFHLNHAIVACALWTALVGWTVLRDARRESLRGIWIGSLLVLAPCLVNICFAALLMHSQRGERLPLDQFVDLYVRLRHPHHYDPRSWPIALWVCFCWAIPIALAARGEGFAWQQARRVFAIIAALIALALIGAGAWYVSETLIQLSLYRFSIYLQLLACIGAGIVICERSRSRGWLIGVIAFVIALASLCAIVTPARRAGFCLFAALSLAPLLHALFANKLPAPGRMLASCAAAMVVVCVTIVGWNRWLGLILMLPKPDPTYLRLCDWARENTPRDAVFLAPPNDMEFRFRARRAIVVNVKGIPQLSTEMPEWRDRLEAVLGLSDLDSLPRGNFFGAADVMGEIYSRRSIDDLAPVARRYGARYVIVTDVTRGGASDLPIVRNEGDRYLLYDLSR
jgi:hypothetical protein